MQKAPLFFPRTYIYWYYNAIVGPMKTILVRNSKRRALLFWGVYFRTFLNIFLNILMPLFGPMLEHQEMKAQGIRGVDLASTFKRERERERVREKETRDKK